MVNRYRSSTITKFKNMLHFKSVLCSCKCLYNQVFYCHIAKYRCQLLYIIGQGSFWELGVICPIKGTYITFSTISITIRLSYQQSHSFFIFILKVTGFQKVNLWKAWNDSKFCLGLPATCKLFPITWPILGVSISLPKKLFPQVGDASFKLLDLLRCSLWQNMIYSAYLVNWGCANF